MNQKESLRRREEHGEVTLDLRDGPADYKLVERRTVTKNQKDQKQKQQENIIETEKKVVSGKRSI